MRDSIEEILDDICLCLDEGYGDRLLAEELKQQSYDLIARINSYIGYLRRCKQGMEEGNT